MNRAVARGIPHRHAHVTHRGRAVRVPELQARRQRSKAKARRGW